MAHSAISGKSQNAGAPRRSAAATSPPTHATMIGNASTCGRANRCGTVNASAAATNTSVVLSLSHLQRNFVSNANVAAIAAAAITTGPLQPAAA